MKRLSSYQILVFITHGKTEATGNLIGSKIADKVASVSKKESTKGLHNNDETKEEDVEITTSKKRYISPEERQEIIEEIGLVSKRDVYF